AFRDLLASDPGLAYAIEIIVKGRGEAVQLAEQLRALPLVDDVRTINDLLPQDQDSKLAILNPLKNQLPAHTDN
ncbi:MAG: hypothetical protein GTO07_21540, partial [Pseudomonas stutzeri]|nr:hypothetical protein [Stutzerimonas stutzeri]